MLSNKDVLKSLPLLASALGQQHGVEVTVSGSKAYTDSKVVNIPALPVDCSADTLAMVRGYIDHEAGGHIRFTDFEAMRRARLSHMEQQIWNCIEDWRVEAKLSAVYPGCKANLEWLARRFFADEWTISKDATTAALSYILLTCRSWSVPELEANRQKERLVVEAGFPGLADDMDILLDAVHSNCPDTKEAIAHARKLAALLQNRIGGAASSQSNSDSEKQQSDQSEQQADQQQRTGKAKGNEAGKEADSEGGSETGKANGGSRSKKPAGGKSNSDTEADQDGEQKQPTVPDLGQMLAAKLGAASEGTPSEQRASVAAVVSSSIPALHDADCSKALLDTAALRYRLQNLLQAQRLSHVAPGRHGRLDTRNVHKMCIGDPKVFRTCAQVQAVNTAVHILVDNSGSMLGRSNQLARAACYALAASLKAIHGVNPAVTAFPAYYPAGSVWPVLRHGESMHKNFGFRASGGTPLAEAVLWAMQDLFRQPEDRKLLLILTDGWPDNPKTCAAALSEAKRLGIECYGIGILDSSVKKFLPDTSEVIRNLKDLSPVLFKLIQKSLTTRR